VAELGVRVESGSDRTGTLSWAAISEVDAPGDDSVSAEALVRAVALAAADALLVRGLRRLEAAVPASDRNGRRALIRAGFRAEGIRRDAQTLTDGEYGDVMLYGRLARDVVDGPHGFSAVMNSTLPRKRLIAHVLIRDDAGRVLLCETRFKPDWELPGGIVEPAESPRLGAVREVREELGIDLAVGRLLVVDWMPPYLGWEDAIEMIFDGGRLSEADLPGLDLQPTEIKGVQLVTVAAAARLLTPLAHRRLSIAAALRSGEMAYLEDGAASR
jgi:8-oxo-dGTP pyrophosphatase MutT (NUDIX family)